MNSLEIRSYLLIRRGLARSRAELARTLDVSRPTASVLAETLIGRGFVEESGRGKSTGGKAPTLLTPVRGVSHNLGIDLGYQDKLSAVLLDGAGEIVRSDEKAYDSTVPDAARSAIKAIFRKFSQDAEITGTGIALSGNVDPESGTIRKSVNPAFIGGAFAAKLKTDLPCPVRLENRSRMAAFSEAFGGAAEHERDFALISLGKSIGSSFSFDGEFYQGIHGEAGELRNLRLDCGLTFEEALARNELERAGLDAAVVRCAEGLTRLLDLIDLDLLVLAGRFADFGADFPERLEKELRRTRDCRVRAARFGKFSAARGIAFRLGEIEVENQPSNHP